MDALPAASLDRLCALIAGRLERVCITGFGAEEAASPPTLVLPGSFNPVHEGHWQLAAAAGRMTGKPAAFELSVVNVDKPPLTAAEVARRLAPFAGRASVWVTQAPTFAAKARLFPAATFAVGADTAARILQPRYYAGGATGMREALAGLRGRGCRFLVAGRVDHAGTFQHLEDLDLPADFRDLFVAIPREAFRVDVSSSALRVGSAR